MRRSRLSKKTVIELKSELLAVGRLLVLMPKAVTKTRWLIEAKCQLMSLLDNRAGLFA